MGAGLTAVLPQVLHGPAAMRGSARGTAVVMVLAGVPALLATLAADPRSSSPVRARLHMVRLGVLAYLLYNCLPLLLATPFNSLFLLYEAMLGLALASIVATWRSLDLGGFTRMPSRPVRRVIAGLIWAVVLANTAAWLGGVLPGLGQGTHPDFLDGTGLITSPTYVQDLAVWLPLAAVAAWWLWSGRVQGVVLAGAYLAMWTLEGISVALDQWFGAHADPASGVVSSDLVVPFLIQACLTGAALLVYVRLLNRSSGAVDRPARPAPASR